MDKKINNKNKLQFNLNNFYEIEKFLNNIKNSSSFIKLYKILKLNKK